MPQQGRFYSAAVRYLFYGLYDLHRIGDRRSRLIDEAHDAIFTGAVGFDGELENISDVHVRCAEIAFIPDGKNVMVDLMIDRVFPGRNIL